MDCSQPGSFAHGILQARIPEWVAISSPGDLPNPRIEPTSPALLTGSLPLGPFISISFILNRATNVYSSRSLYAYEIQNKTKQKNPINTVPGTCFMASLPKINSTVLFHQVLAVYRFCGSLYLFMKFWITSEFEQYVILITFYPSWYNHF